MPPYSPFRRLRRREILSILNPSTSDDIEVDMTIELDKVNPEFRELTDLLLFSDRMDLDLSEYKRLLRENHDIHFDYLWDRFKRSSEIYWQDGHRFWNSRLSFFLSLNEKSLAKHIEDHLEKRMFGLVRGKHSIDAKYDIAYLQYVEFCRVKFDRKESLASIKTYLTDLPQHLNAEKIIKIVSSFIPMVFADIDEYVGVITKKITQSARHFDLLQALEERGVSFDKSPIIQLALGIIVERAHNEKNRRAFFAIINDNQVRQGLKNLYNSSHRDKLLEFLESCDYQMIEDHHLRNIKNIIDLDVSVADDLAIIYADKLYHRNTGHKKANADRLIRLMKLIPQITPKKILAYLSSNNKMSDIKYVLNAFPDLRKLAAFV